MQPFHIMCVNNYNFKYVIFWEYSLITHVFDQYIFLFILIKLNPSQLFFRFLHYVYCFLSNHKPFFSEYPAYFNLFIQATIFITLIIPLTHMFLFYVFWCLYFPCFFTCIEFSISLPQLQVITGKTHWSKTFLLQIYRNFSLKY